MLRELRARAQHRRHDRASAFGTLWPASLAIVMLLMGVLLFLSSDHL